MRMVIGVVCAIIAVAIVVIDIVSFAIVHH
jgi:hypothetical protein